MGWFWSASSPKPEGSSGTTAPPTSTPPPAAATPPSKATPVESEAASADREVAAFMKLLMDDTKSSKPSQPPPPPPPQQQQITPLPQKESSWFSSWSATSRGDDPSPEPTPPPPADTRTHQSRAMSEHSLPSEMSCRDAFDYAWHCHTVGSQWNAVYRYGTVRPCTELWDDFWFCMRIKSYEPEVKAEAVRAHYRAKEEAKYGGGKPSSEDVWESREGRVEKGSVFNREFEPPVVDDDEYNRVDAEQRRMIRKMVEERDRKAAENNKE